MPVDEIQSEQQFNEYLKNRKGSYKYIVVDFYATWCGPCKKMAPQLEKMSESYKNVLFLKVDVDGDAGTVAEKYGVSSLPTFMFFDAGSDKPSQQSVIGADPKRLEQTVKNMSSKASSVIVEL